ncbi:MAG: tetratricopeptide repeat protein [Deltaproteobacteria bacterium]|nr:tetratricopeptide repeat protein [Deltaproteobacteria bacterium]
MLQEYENLTSQGAAAVEKGNFMEAMMLFENASQIMKTPLVDCYLGYCLAREQGKLKEGAKMCLEAIQKDPRNPLFYLNLGRIYALAGQKLQAIRTYQKGLKMGCDQRIIAELRHLGIRRNPVFKKLSRRNPLNKYCGMVFRRLGLR